MIKIKTRNKFLRLQINFQIFFDQNFFKTQQLESHCNGKSLISGDTLFSGGNFGRTDLPTGSMDDMRKSILHLADLDVVQLFPGHGPYAISAVTEQISLAVMLASRL